MRAILNTPSDPTTGTCRDQITIIVSEATSAAIGLEQKVSDAR